MGKSEISEIRRRDVLGLGAVAITGPAVVGPLTRAQRSIRAATDFFHRAERKSSEHIHSPHAFQEALRHVIHADVGQSVQLPNGRILWIFGDTTEINGKPTGNYFPHNTFVLQEPGTLNFSMVQGEKGGFQQVPNWTSLEYGKKKTDSVFWPTCPVVEGDKLYVFGIRVKETKTNFTVGNPYVAVFDAQTLTYEGRAELPGGSDGIVWGGALKGSNNGKKGWWISGSHTVSQFDKAGDFAFVPAGEIANPAAWEVKTNVIPASDAIGTIFDILKTKNGYEGVTKQHDELGSQIELLRTSSLTGTWTVEKTFPAPDPQQTVTYAVALHPEQPSPKGYVLASYSVLGQEKSYFPHFTYVRL